MILIHSYSSFISHHFIQAYGEYKTPGPLKNPVGKRCPYMCLWFYTIVNNRKKTNCNKKKKYVNFLIQKEGQPFTTILNIFFKENLVKNVLQKSLK